MLPKRPQVSRLYEFGPFVLNVADRLLSKNGSPISLAPKAFDVLVVLVEKSGSLVSKEDLIERVWQGAFIEEGNIPVNVSAVRRALGDNISHPIYVATVPTQGYRFIAPVKALNTSPKEQPANPIEADASYEQEATLDSTTRASLSSPVRNHIWHLLAVSGLYALYYSVSFLLEVAYEYETYGAKAREIVPLVFLWVLGTSLVGLSWGLSQTARGSTSGTLISLSFFIGAALLLYLTLALFLPNIAITRASFATYPAEGAFLKSVIYALPLVVLFVVLPAHFIVSFERELKWRGSPEPAHKLQPAAGGSVYLKTWWLAASLFATFCITLAANARLFENLQPSPNTGLFIQLSQWRFLLYFLLGLECVLWYHHSQRRLNSQKGQNLIVGNALTSGLMNKTKPPFKWWVVVLVSLMLVVGSVTASLYVFRVSQHRAAPTPTRSFSYWLNVQKVRDGRNYEDDFQATDQQVFEGGDKFRLHVSSPDQGYLYVIDEAPPELDGARLTMLYPTPSRDNAFVLNQPVHTNWHSFPGTSGTENLWIIWSTAMIREFETAKIDAFENKRGALTNPSSLLAVREFISEHAVRKPESSTDTTSQMTHVRGSGDVVIKQVLIQHQ